MGESSSMHCVEFAFVVTNQKLDSFVPYTTMCNNHDYHHVGGFLHNKSSVKVIQFLKATFGWLEFHSHTLKVKVTRMPQNLREKVQACRHISRAIFVIFIAQPVLKSALSQRI